MGAGLLRRAWRLASAISSALLISKNPVRVLLPDFSSVWASDNPYPKGWMDRYQDAWSILGLETTDPDNPLPTN
jgi:hypothetical protein